MNNVSIKLRKPCLKFNLLKNEFLYFIDKVLCINYYHIGHHTIDISTDYS